MAVNPSMTRGAARKAAILVLAVGPDFARSIFSRLTDAEMKQLVEAASALGEVGDQEVVEILREFRDGLMRGGVPRLGAGRMFERMVEDALGTERARHLLKPAVTEDPFEVCAKADAKDLALVLKNEHPQTIALVLVSLPADKTSAILERFGAQVASDLVLRMSRLGPVSKDVRNDVGSALVAELRALGTFDGLETLDGATLAIDVTKALPAEFSDELLESLEETEYEFASNLRSKLFVFDDLARLDARQMQRLLREVDTKSLMLALKGASDDAKAAVFAAMSSRAVQMLQDDMEASPPVRIADAEAAQSEVLDVAFRLEGDGVIVLPRGGGGRDMV